MIDMLATLAPNAIVRDVALLEPGDSPLWTAAVDIGLADARAGSDRAEAPAAGPTFDRVGACGWTRADTLARGAGEAIERLGLIPVADDPLRVAAVAAGAARRVCVGTPEAARSVPALDAVTTDCVRALELGDGGELLVPAAVVDDPARGVPAGWVDASPSGVAAGPSWEYATRQALLESIERDAVQACWVLRPPVAVVRPGDLPGDRSHADSRHAARLAAWLDAEALTARTFLLPTGVAGVTAALTVVLDEREGRSLLAAGSRAGRSLPAIVHGSAREAVQVMTALRRLAAVRGPLPAGDPVTGESARARYCLGPLPAAHVASWLERCHPASAGAPVSEPEPALAELVADLRADGLRPLACDLTPRLPERARALGWHAVRALVLGHQALRMDERHDWSWVRPRLAQWAERSGTRLPHDLAALAPHPLI